MKKKIAQKKIKKQEDRNNLCPGVTILDVFLKTKN